jgi:hypothetical protein
MESLEQYGKLAPASAGGLLKWLLLRAAPVLAGMAQRSGLSFDVRCAGRHADALRCGPAGLPLQPAHEGGRARPDDP